MFRIVRQDPPEPTTRSQTDVSPPVTQRAIPARADIAVSSVEAAGSGWS